MQQTNLQRIPEMALAALMALVLACGLTTAIPANAHTAHDDAAQSQAVASKATAAQNTATDSQISTAATNLTKRFLQTGSDAVISNGTYYAALAANILGKGEYLDSAMIIESLKEAKTGPYFSAGAYAKYIHALTAAGVDCTAAAIDGSTANLMAEMEGMIGDPSNVDAFSAVCILPLYSYDLYQTESSDEFAQALTAKIVASVDESGLVGDYGYFDSQTTAQAILALLPYAQDSSDVSTAVSEMTEAVRGMQCADGGFGYNTGDAVGNIDATANIIAALAAQGIDVNSPNASGNSALGFLISNTDDTTYSTFEGISPSNEVMTAATAYAAVASAKTGKNIMSIDREAADKPRIASASLSYTLATYSGKYKKPSVTVKNANGAKLSSSKYSVSYSSNKYVGTATVTITGTGTYGGIIVKTFNIKPKSTYLTSLSAGKGKLYAKWHKQSTQTTGYELRYSTSSSYKTYKTVKTTSNKTLSKTISKLKSKKKYYVKVRTYKTVNGVNYYSSWSSSKARTTK